MLLPPCCRPRRTRPHGDSGAGAPRACMVRPRVLSSWRPPDVLSHSVLAVYGAVGDPDQRRVARGGGPILIALGTIAGGPGAIPPATGLRRRRRSNRDELRGGSAAAPA